MPVLKHGPVGRNVHFVISTLTSCMILDIVCCWNRKLSTLCIVTDIVHRYANNNA